MRGNYLIPANTSRGKLIFGLFREIDLAIFLTGLGITFVLLMILPLQNTTMAILAVAPALVCSLLVAPVPNYHNVMTVIIETYRFFTTQQKYVWKGWCFMYESNNDKQDNDRLDQRPTGNK